MADEPTSAVASPETPPVEGRETPATSKTPPPDVVSRTDFQKAQAVWEQRNRQLLTQLQQVQQQVEQQTIANLPDDERQTYQQQRYAQTLAAQLQQTQAELAAHKQEAQVTQALLRCAQKTGTPMVELRQVWDQTQDADAVWEYGWDKRAESEDKERKTAERATRKEANQVDTGAGRSITSLSQWETAIAEAQTNKDAVAYNRLLRQRPDK